MASSWAGSSDLACSSLYNFSCSLSSCSFGGVIISFGLACHCFVHLLSSAFFPFVIILSHLFLSSLSLLSSTLPHDYHLWGSEEESPIDTARVPHWSDWQLLVFNHYFQRQKKTHCSTCTTWPWWRLLSCGLLMKSHHPYSFTVGFHKGNNGNTMLI